MQDLSFIKEKQNFICDMDGVIYHGNKLLPNVKEFIAWLEKESVCFLFQATKRKGPKVLQRALCLLR